VTSPAGQAEHVHRLGGSRSVLPGGMSFRRSSKNFGFTSAPGSELGADHAREADGARGELEAEAGALRPVSRAAREGAQVALPA
jgi:hypothetical protein